jgi:hypothetical protein
MKAINKKFIIAGAAVAAVIAGFLIIRKKVQSQPLLGEPGVPQAGTAGISPTKKVSGVTYPLKQGSGYGSSNFAENAAVKKLQQAINMQLTLKPYLGIAMLDVDGDFGPKTEAAVQKLLGVNQVSYSLYQEMLAKSAKNVMNLLSLSLS